MKKLFCLLAALMLTAFGAWAEGDVALIAASAGKADALLLKSEKCCVLIDAGHLRSRGRVLLAMEKAGVTALDAVILTHTDSDHADGLQWLAESEIPVGRWIGSKYSTVKKAEKHPLTVAAKARGVSPEWVKAGDAVVLEDMTLEVLAPSEASADKDNDNSLVLRVQTDAGAFLLCGDMEYPEEQRLLASGQDLRCTLMKVANHGDDDTCSPAFLEKAAPKIAIISTSTEEKPSTPDARLLLMLGAAGTETYVTDACTGGVIARASNGALAVERYDAPKANARIAMALFPEDEVIVLTNAGESDVDLSGAMLCNDRETKWTVLGDGAVLRAGQTLTIGTRSTKDTQYDWLWDDKKVLRKKKEDVIVLYDAYGTELVRAAG